MPDKPTYTNKQTDEELAKQIDQQFLLSKRYLDPIHSKMNQQEELYRSYIDKTNYPHGARVFDPRIFRVIETVTPRMVANEPTGSFYPTEQGDVNTSQILNAMIKYDWRRAEMFPKLVMFVKSMLIFGTAFGRVHWDLRTAERTRMVPRKLNGRMVWSPRNTEKIQVDEFDGPNFEVLNIYDCFPDPNATSLHDMRWFIYRTFKTLEELKAENETRGTDYYKNLDKLEEAIELKRKDGSKTNVQSGGQPADMQYREHRRIMLSTQEFRGQDEANPEIVILKRFTRDGWCDYVPEYDIVIREIDNPYFHGELPLVYGVDYPYPGELFGMGEIEPIDRIQRAINAVLNQRLDNVQLTLRTMWKVKKNAQVDLHTLVSAPGNIIMTGDMNAVEPIETPDVTGATFVQTMNYLTASLQNGSGITDYTMGINDNAHTQNETATGTRLIQQEANAQFKLKIQLFNHMVIQRIANQWKDLRIQYTTEKQSLRILGREEVQKMIETTGLSQVGLDGQEIVPGELETPAKLEVQGDGDFAFLTVLPEDIQPSTAGDYDFIAITSAEQLSDPIAMQENFFAYVDRVSTPEFAQGLATQQKQLNYVGIAEKMADKLQQGLEAKDIITDLAPPPQVDPMTGQPANAPMDPAMLDPLKMPMENPIANPLANGMTQPPAEGGAQYGPTQ